jgi:hypothetical protein
MTAARPSGVAAHLGIRLREYDARIRTFIPRYEDMLDAAAAALRALRRTDPLIVDLGTGSGALAARCPRCDAITASFALHHVRTRRRKAALYARCHAALRSGGLLVTADCCTASHPRLRSIDRAAWQAHLERSYTRRRAAAFLRAWADEDVYFTLEEEIALLRSAGFAVDVPWRRDSFAVVVAAK